MKNPETLADLWHRLAGKLSKVTAFDIVDAFENERDPNAWCLMTPCIEVGSTEVTVGLRIPEPHTHHAHTEVLGQTLAIQVLKSGQNPEKAPLVDFFRRAIRLPVPVSGTCSHHFEGPFLVVVVSRELEQSGAAQPAERGHQELKGRSGAGNAPAATRVEEAVSRRAKSPGRGPENADLVAFQGSCRGVG